MDRTIIMQKKKTGVAPTAATTHRAVSFADYSELTIIPRDEGSVHEGWYSQDDKEHFSRQLIGDAVQMSRLLSTTPAVRLTQDELAECVGIESFLHQDVAHLQARKRAHVQAIVAAHVLKYNKNELRFLSEMSSDQARKNALHHAVARGMGNG